MALNVPTLEALRQQILDDYRGRFPDDDLAASSDNYKRLTVLALAAWQLMHGQRTIEKDLSPLHAGEDKLAEHGYIKNVQRKGATPARKAGALRVSGTPDAVVDPQSELVHVSGLRYRPDETAAIPAQGYIDIAVVAVDVGSATRLTAGETLTFTAPPAGISAVATLQLALDEDGEDREAVGAYRLRILDSWQRPAAGGNAHDFRAWAEAVTGVASAYVYPWRHGHGGVDVAALHAGAGVVRLLSAPERAELQAVLRAKRPIASKATRVIEVTARTQNVELAVEIMPGYPAAWDWDDTGGALTVDDWEESTRTLSFAAARPEDMKAGHRLVLRDLAGLGDGRLLSIERLGAAATDVVLAKSTLPSEAPVAGDAVYAGSDLSEAVRAELLADLNALGPAIGGFGIGDWRDEFAPGALEAAALRVSGLRRALVLEPADTVTPDDPAYPADETIELLIPGRVLVRRRV